MQYLLVGSNHCFVFFIGSADSKKNTEYHRPYPIVFNVIYCAFPIFQTIIVVAADESLNDFSQTWYSLS